MKAIGALFKEPPVHSDKGDRYTNDICSKNSDTSYTIDGRDISFPVVVADAAMLMNGFLVDAKAAQTMLDGFAPCNTSNLSRPLCFSLLTL